MNKGSEERESECERMCVREHECSRAAGPTHSGKPFFHSLLTHFTIHMLLTSSTSEVGQLGNRFDELLALQHLFKRLCFGVWCLVFGVWCLVFGVWGFGFEVWGLEFRVDCLGAYDSNLFGSRVLRFGFWVLGLGFGVWGLGFWVWGLGFGVWGLGFEILGLGLGVVGWDVELGDWDSGSTDRTRTRGSYP